jgi:predicted DCC family thiol-disulfide oxidoreductase YuxK
MASVLFALTEVDSPMTPEPRRENNPSAPERPIIFFDGVCGVCNAFVDALLRLDRRRVFSFAPIQGETARALLPPLPEDSGEWSLVYLDERGTFERSDACIEIARRLGGGWTLLGQLRFVPRFLREGVYRWVARNRYRLFRQRETCRLPTTEERARFLP